MRAPGPFDRPLYREIEHTADVGILVEAPTAACLFEQAALATYALMLSSVGVEPRERRTVRAEGSDWSDLLQRWLSEILALFAIEGFVAVEVEVATMGSTTVGGVLWGEKFDPLRHEFYSEIKAVTYHELAVTRDESGWHASVIFDV